MVPSLHIKCEICVKYIAQEFNDNNNNNTGDEVMSKNNKQKVCQIFIIATSV